MKGSSLCVYVFNGLYVQLQSVRCVYVLVHEPPMRCWSIRARGGQGISDFEKFVRDTIVCAGEVPWFCFCLSTRAIKGVTGS